MSVLWKKQFCANPLRNRAGHTHRSAVEGLALECLTQNTTSTESSAGALPALRLSPGADAALPLSESSSRRSRQQPRVVWCTVISSIRKIKHRFAETSDATLPSLPHYELRILRTRQGHRLGTHGKLAPPAKRPKHRRSSARECSQQVADSLPHASCMLPTRLAAWSEKWNVSLEVLFGVVWSIIKATGLLLVTSCYNHELRDKLFKV